MMRFRNKNSDASRRGFSLLELAVIFVLSGLALTAAVQLAKQYGGHQDVVTNQERIKTVQDALTKYVKDNGALPCPARRDLPISDANYGKMINCGDGGSMTGTVSVAGIPSTGGSGLVRIGAIPARTLGLADAYMENVWGKLFTYAVSEDLAESYDPLKAAVGVVNPATGTSILSAPGPAAATYVIINHGKTGKGAFTENGTRPIACNAGLGTYEDWNCDDDANFAVAPYSTAAGVNRFQNNVFFATGLDIMQYPTCATNQTLTSTDGLTFSCKDLSISPTLCGPTETMTTVVVAGVTTITCVTTMNPPPDCADGEVLVADPNGIDFQCLALPPPAVPTLPVCGAGKSLTSDGTTVSCAQLTLPPAPTQVSCNAAGMADPTSGNSPYPWYGCTATCPAGTTVTGGSMDEDVDNNYGMIMMQSGNGWFCAYSIASCRGSIARPCGLHCRALCNRVVIQ